MRLETSQITGEAEAIAFTAEPAASDIDVFDSNNVAFNGSFCINGEGIGVTIRTGTATVTALLTLKYPSTLLFR